MEVARREEEEEESAGLLGGQDDDDDHDHDHELLGGPGASGDEGGVLSQIDFGRTLRFTLVGAAFLAPALHTWYGFLIRTLPGTAPATVVKRVALDQLMFTPVFLAGFLSTLMVLDGNAAKVRKAEERAHFEQYLSGRGGLEGFASTVACMSGFVWSRNFFSRPMTFGKSWIYSRVSWCPQGRYDLPPKILLSPSTFYVHMWLLAALPLSS